MFEGVTIGELVVASSWAVVLTAVVAERVHLRLRTGSCRLGDLVVSGGMLVGSLVAGALLGPTLADLWAFVAQSAPEAGRALVGRHRVVEFLVAFVAWDLAGFAYHWIGHHTGPGWAAHRPHHTGRHYDLSLAGRQTWVPWASLVTFPLVALTGVSFESAIVCAAVSNAWQALVHTAAPVSLPRRLASVVMTPATHRWHHESDTPVNLGPVLTWWDRVAGTFEAPPTPNSTDLLDRPVSTGNLLALQFEGWWALARRPGICARGSQQTGLSDTHSGDSRGLRHGCRSRSRRRTARG